MLHRAYALSSTTEAFDKELPNYTLHVYSCLDYPIDLINSTINMFIQNIATKPEKKVDHGNTIRIVLPFTDHIATNAVRRHIRDLTNKIGVTS